MHDLKGLVKVRAYRVLRAGKMKSKGSRSLDVKACSLSGNGTTTSHSSNACAKSPLNRQQMLNCKKRLTVIHDVQNNTCKIIIHLKSPNQHLATIHLYLLSGALFSR